MRARLIILVVAMLMTSTAVNLSAHVGSPDVYFEGNAGKYRLLVAIRTPPVVPGVAEIEVRVLDGSPRDVRVVPLRLTGPGATFAPVPDHATRSEVDPRLYRAHLWMMVAGPWQVRINVDGDAGAGELSVPVDALASRTLRMDTRLALILLPFGLFLVLGFIALVGASVGTAQTAPGEQTPPNRLRRARIARIVAFAFAIVVLVLGNLWWGQEAKAYDEYIYKPLQLQPQLNAADGSLRLALHDPGWLEFRVLDDLVPDHGHAMHLFAVRTPGLDRLLHLHPEQQAQEPGSFVQHLPAAAAGGSGKSGSSDNSGSSSSSSSSSGSGRASSAAGAGSYRLFADVVHATGLPETAVANVTLPAIDAAALSGDDSGATAPADGAFQPDRVIADLPGGSHMTWVRDAGAMKAKQPYLLTFRVDDADGQPARDLSLYMGMPGHAIVLRRDLAVFAHVHPSGTPPMASLALTANASANGGAPHATASATTASANINAGAAGAADGPTTAGGPANSHAQHMAAAAAAAAAGAVSPTVAFPYGFPSPGEYRLFVQVKRGAGAGVQTGVFDVRVE
jgi:hypothetical protein